MSLPRRSPTSRPDSPTTYTKETPNPQEQDEDEDEDEREHLYSNPLPKFDGNPWAESLKVLSQSDTARCKVWMKDVERLLVVAGIFSAIVTSFLLQSYSSLQPNDQASTNEFLAHISQQLMIIATRNTTSPTPEALNPSIPNFAPSTTAVRVNTLWFFSLVFSVTYVLVGMLGIQWLAEHAVLTQDSSPPNITQFSLRHMYIEALDRWYVPQIFATLSMLLPVSVMLFLIGLVDFLWDLNPVVALPVSVPIGLTLLFLFITTILPTLQLLWLDLPLHSRTRKVRSPCPYRSSQSSVFLQAILVIQRILRQYLTGPALEFFKLSHRRSSLARLTEYVYPKDGVLSGSWTGYGQLWLHRREVEFLSAKELGDFKVTNANTLTPYGNAHYDCVHGLLKVHRLSPNTNIGNFQVALFNCFQDSVWEKHANPSKRTRFLNYIFSLRRNQHPSHDKDRTGPMNDQKLSAPVKEDINRLMLYRSSSDAFQSIIRPHLAETSIHLARWLALQDCSPSTNDEFFQACWSCIRPSNTIPVVSNAKHTKNLPGNAVNPLPQFDLHDQVQRHHWHGVSQLDDSSVYDIVVSRFAAYHKNWNISPEKRPDSLFIMVTCFIFWMRASREDSERVKSLLPTLQLYADDIKRREGDDHAHFARLAESMGASDEIRAVWNFPHSYFSQSGSQILSPSATMNDISDNFQGEKALEEVVVEEVQRDQTDAVYYR